MSPAVPVLRVLLLVIAAAMPVADLFAAPPRFRDVQFYTTSTPDPADAGRIVATMRVLNRGAAPLDVRMTLDANPAAGFAGSTFDVRVDAAKEAAWTFELKPPAGLKREILKGGVTFGKDVEPDRELYVAVCGQDPADFADARVTKISAKAEVVATYAPRTPQSVAKLTGAARQLQSDTPVVLAASGASKYRVVSDVDLADAIADLNHCFEIRAGVKLPLGADGDGPAIRLRKVEPPAGWPSAEAYRLRTDGADVVIESPTVEGLRHGVYGLLADHLDCHWFMPKKLGEEFGLVGDRTVRLAGPIDETRSPSFFSSRGMSWGTAPRWDAQNRSMINRGRMNFGHAWAGFIDKAKYPYDKFPDMWSRDRSGKVQVFDSTWSATNFCSTNPDVIRIVAEKVNAAFDADPNAIVQSIDPNDLSPLCQCDRCLALDKKYGVQPTDDKQMADRLMHFSQEIYDRLKPEHKDKFLGILAYGFQTRAPKNATPHAHHASMVCNFPYYFDHTRPFNDPTSPQNREFEAIVRGWGSKVKQLGYYDYYGMFDFFGPWGIVHKMREDLPAFKELGGTFVVIESQPNFAMNGLNVYVASRLVWDVDADVDVLVEEYVMKFFGRAANPMREFFAAAERHYALTRPGVRAQERVGERPEFWTELDGYLKEAERLTGDLPESEKRFKDRISFTRDGFDFGRRFRELGAHASDAAWLRETKTQFDRMKATYTSEDPYWPTMLAPYFYPDVDAMLKAAEKPKG